MTAIHPVDGTIVPHAALYESDTWTQHGDGLGLSVLKDIHKAVLAQQQDMLEAITRIDQPNKYILCDENERQILFLEEESTGNTQRHRDFKVIAKDAYGKKVFTVKRPMKFCSYCFFCCSCIECCRNEAEIKTDQKELGQLLQNWSFSRPFFTIYDDSEKPLYNIMGGSALCTATTEYEIQTEDGTQLGSIKKLGVSTGFGCNKYKIKFPENCSLEAKALIIGTNIFFDYRFHFLAPPRPRRGYATQHRRGHLNF